MQTDQTLSHIKPAEIRRTWKRICYLADLVQETGKIRMTPFLTPAEWCEADSVMSHYQHIQWKLQGGYPNAERRRMILLPVAEKKPLTHTVIDVIRLVPTHHRSSLTHRDYLGALLGLPMDRDNIGDILVQENEALVALMPEKRSFVETQLIQVGSTPVKIDSASTEALSHRTGTMTVKSGAVSSMRLDAVLAMALKMSRKKAQLLIKRKQVKLNWKPVQRPDETVHQEDFLSVQGMGRIKIIEVREKSKGRRWQIQAGWME